MTWLPINATGYFKDPMKIDAFKKFNDYLNSNEPVPYHLQLLADAREQAIIHKNYNLSIVLSSTATDFYLKDRLPLYLSHAANASETFRIKWPKYNS